MIARQVDSRWCRA